MLEHQCKGIEQRAVFDDLRRRRRNRLEQNTHARVQQLAFTRHREQHRIDATAAAALAARLADRREQRREAVLAGLHLLFEHAECFAAIDRRQPPLAQLLDQYRDRRQRGPQRVGGLGRHRTDGLDATRRQGLFAGARDGALVRARQARHGSGEVGDDAHEHQFARRVHAFAECGHVGMKPVQQHQARGRGRCKGQQAAPGECIGRQRQRHQIEQDERIGNAAGLVDDVGQQDQVTQQLVEKHLFRRRGAALQSRLHEIAQRTDRQQHQAHTQQRKVGELAAPDQQRCDTRARHQQASDHQQRQQATVQRALAVRVDQVATPARGRAAEQGAPGTHTTASRARIRRVGRPVAAVNQRHNMPW